VSPRSEIRRRGRLEGRCVFLSASVPAPERAEQYRRVEDAHLEIEEAVVSLARAVFTEGGTLVFGGHPAISPLVAMVAGEYIRPRSVEVGEGEVRPPIRIYQSRAFEGVLPDETLAMFRAGYATLHWTEAVAGERFDPKAPRDRPPCPRSLRHMRERMIGETEPVAMVCIGGMEGVEEEAEIFRELRPGAPVYVFGETGGAAALLAARRGDGAPRVIDREVLERLEHHRARDRGASRAAAEPGKPPVPYPLIAQMLVEELIHLDDRPRR
jgi:SLOG-like protein